MTADDEVKELLIRTLRAVEPWSREIILIGGWAMHLYRYIEGADSSVDVVLTADIDFAVPKRLASAGEFGQRLAEQRLVRIPSRTTNPPITYFQAEEHGSEHLAPSYIEFLTPLVGRENQAPVFFAPDVTAQCLRYLDLSFERPTTLLLARVPMLAHTGVERIQVPNPASYLLAKALVYKLRKPDRKDKDCAYIYLLACVTRHIWTDVRHDLDALKVHPSWRQRGYEQLRTLFASNDGEGPVRAARSLANLQHPERVIRMVVQRFLQALGVVTPS